ncbi:MULTISPECIES: SusC/RagA family TonB-linked outer membrane protein [Butyricimonas]|uniref:SusC/RagA family TonB-linked outer membrane protein n=1 Tax=Butyricimonas TaxID=574697 RepID=UPI0007FB244E|nr:MULTISPECIES: SusC/RagA family TonB-linked outer membrane protein [Butyricimonas]
MKKNDTLGYFKREKLWRRLLSVKFLCLCMLIQNLAFSAGYSQDVKLTLKADNKSLTDIFAEIRGKSQYTFVYNLDDLQNIRVKSLDVKDASIKEVLDKCLKGTGFSYEIEDHVVIVRADRPAQDEVKKVTLKGIVMTTDSVPIAGVTVLLRGTYMGVITNIKGEFEMTIPEQKEIVLLVSFVGMETQEVKISDVKKTIKVIMKDKIDQLDEVVVTGYGQTTKRRATGSVGVLTQEAFANKPVPNVDMLLQGQLAGVSVQAVSGRPGESAKIRIRGTNTISGDAEPLWVIDGVPIQQDVPEISTGLIKSGSLNDIFVRGIAGINPNDIENVTILKDASAAAIYGSRAAGGVIVVTTKKGRPGKMTVNYSANFTMGLKPQRDPDLMNAREKLAWEQELWDEFSAESYEYNQTASRKKHSPIIGIVGMLRADKLGKNNTLWTEDNFDEMKMNSAEQDAYIAELGKTTTDWFDVIFRNSFSMSHNLSFSGGSNQVTYYFSMGYNQDNGLVKETDYERYNINAKINTRPTERINLGFGIDLAKLQSRGSSMDVDPFEYAYFANPYEKPYNEDGSYRADMTYFNMAALSDGQGAVTPLLPAEGFNILREMKETKGNADQTNAAVRLDLEYRFSNKVKFSGLASYTYTDNKMKDVKKKDTYAAFNERLYFDENNKDMVPYGSITRSSSAGDSYSARGQFSYEDLYFDSHRVTLLAGAELRGDKTEQSYSKRYGYDDVTGNSAMPLPPNATVNDVKKYAELIDKLAGEATRQNRFASFYAALDYNFRERYLLSVTFRTDGSNNFGSDEQFNPTWSLGAMWNIDQESFMEPLRPVLSRLTLRTAMGYTGNIVKSVKKDLVLSYSTSYWNGERTGSVLSAPNPKIRWEKTRDMKVALDFGLFDDRVSGLVEAYYRKSTDLVSSVDVLSTTGFSNQAFNTSTVVNKGIEGTLQVEVLDGRDFKLKLGANIALNRNKLTRFKKENETVMRDGYLESYPLEAVFGGIYTGIDPRDGVYTYVLRPDAQIYKGSDLQVADNYRYYLGTSTAPVTGGFNVKFFYRNLGLNVGAYFSSGAKIVDKINSPVSYSAATSLITGEKPQTAYSDLYRNHLNVRKDMVNRWTKERTTGVKYPRIVDYLGERLLLDEYNVHTTTITDGTYLENVSFLRIRDITLTYSLPGHWNRFLGLSSVNLSLSLNNFFTFTNYSGIDPETPGTTYPLTRSVTWGISVGF